MGSGKDMTNDTPIGAQSGAPLADQVVLNALPYAAVICDRTGKVLLCNDAIARMIGVSRTACLAVQRAFFPRVY